MYKVFRADLHVHTVLSPCGSLEMSPVRIIDEALRKHIDILAVTDHNSTKQCRVVMELGKQSGLTVWGGAEINTREEVHCLALFDAPEAIDRFQEWLDQWLIKVPNNPDFFGDQVWVDAFDNILGEENRLLISSVDRNLDESFEAVKALGGVFIPAHIDRPSNSLNSQLGFVPPDIKADALEISPNVVAEVVEKKGWGKIKPLVAGSDAHWPENLGRHLTLLNMKNASFEEFERALNAVGGRWVVPELLWPLKGGKVKEE